ncbi:hypothetical protein CN065_14140 [Sinorhizobium meliloti]|uniref:hypothetical protein n=1 Tax=Rhizobium meliloti TaxID=382 RepID=UPI000B4985B9|nr:hypothetical protein [Sinorhizobium meliloti]ASP98433.1 hypothetical protein CDO24_13920 [Sinorhizobium meliloti]MQV66178.1 hypothetical protein [Sinorhizobium meliloti]RVQ39332.1 hypothetical protein CN065_14140 [Sinorhizobium meliloti]
MSTLDTRIDTRKRMPLVDLQFSFRLDRRFWHGGDPEWSREISLQARDWLCSMPHVIGSAPYTEELSLFIWKDRDNSRGVDLVYLMIASEEHMNKTAHERNGAIGVSLTFGAGMSTYDIADALAKDDVMDSLQEVLELVLAQGRLLIHST